ncbi:hypothetical protein FPHOBKDP_00113 [Listeria phage LPJP1]|nr:hypothetical protein FPHOBKDP_00113 [Listeria phage LPJP1]
MSDDLFSKLNNVNMDKLDKKDSMIKASKDPSEKSKRKKLTGPLHIDVDSIENQTELALITAEFINEQGEKGKTFEEFFEKFDLDNPNNEGRASNIFYRLRKKGATSYSSLSDIAKALGYKPVINFVPLDEDDEEETQEDIDTNNIDDLFNK